MKSSINNIHIKYKKRSIFKKENSQKIIFKFKKFETRLNLIQRFENCSWEYLDIEDDDYFQTVSVEIT